MPPIHSRSALGSLQIHFKFTTVVQNCQIRVAGRMPGGYLTIAPCSWSARSLRARRKHSGLRPETPFVTTGAERRCTFVGASLYFRFSGLAHWRKSPMAAAERRCTFVRASLNFRFFRNGPAGRHRPWRPAGAPLGERRSLDVRVRLVFNLITLENF